MDMKTTEKVGPGGAQVDAVVRQRLATMLEDKIFADFASNTTGASTAPPLTMAELLRSAKAIIDATPPSPKLPRLIQMPYPLKQARSHRAKRINKKWLKRYGKVADTSVDDGRCYVFNDFFGVKTVAAYPGTYWRLQVGIRDAYPGAVVYMQESAHELGFPFEKEYIGDPAFEQMERRAV